MSLKEHYLKNVMPVLQQEFDIKNVMQIGKIVKIVISVGSGDGAKDAKLLQNIADTVSLISGQRAVITKAKKSVAAFKLREGMNVGVKVTLRANNMYNF